MNAQQECHPWRLRYLGDRTPLPPRHRRPHFEPAIDSAFATDEPLLLVNDYGAACSLLLVWRRAEEHGLACRDFIACIF